MKITTYITNIEDFPALAEVRSAVSGNYRLAP